MATQWGRIKAAWLKGDVTYAELAKKYKISVKTIQNRASKEGWSKEKRTIAEEVGKATRARIVKNKTEMLELLIEANQSMAQALKDLSARIAANPDLLMGGKMDAKAADSLSKAIETTTRTQRDLLKLPTLDQDLHAKEFRVSKKVQEAKMKLDREKWEAEKLEKEELKSEIGGTRIKVIIEGDDEGGPVDE